MRQITADLTAVQLVRSPRARVTVTVEARGQNPLMPAVEWAELIGNPGQSSFDPTALVGLTTGNLRWYKAESGALKQYTVVGPSSASAWTGASSTTLVAITSLAVAALRVPGGTTLRLWYLDAGNVKYIESANQGSSYGSAVTVYSGGDAVGDLVVSYISNGTIANGPWFFGFSTQSAGIYTPRFGYHNGAAWVTHAYDANWQAAGIDAYGDVTSEHRVLVFRQEGYGASRLRMLDKSGSSYNNARDLDQTQAGLFGLELCYYRFFQIPEHNCMMGIAGEGGYGSGIVLGIAGLWTATDNLVDEPIMLPDIAGVKSQPYSCIAGSGSPPGADVYLAGDTVVYHGSPQSATGTTLEPIKYTYDEHQVELEFKPGIATLYVGQILVITRTLSWGTQTGSEVFRAIIVRVEQGTDVVQVVAMDALGWLGTARCRRPSILNDGTAAGVAEVMRKLAARFGLTVSVDNADLETDAVMPFTLAPAESLRGAAFRVGSQTEYYLVPANDGTFSLTMITPGDSDSGDYNDTAHEYGHSGTQQPVAKAAVISDYRNLAFSYVLGTYSTDPEDGGAVAMAAGPVIANTRPLSYSLTNSRYNTTTRVELAAAAEAARQRRLPVTGMIEGQANLALELYDRVEVTEPLLGWSAKHFRVRRIKEVYDRGRLTQTVYLGDE